MPFLCNKSNAVWSVVILTSGMLCSVEVPPTVSSFCLFVFFNVIWSNLFSSVCSAMCLTVLRLHSSMCYAKNPVGYNLMQHSKCSVHFGHHILWTCSCLCSNRECLMTN